MDRGWGLALENSNQIDFFGNKSSVYGCNSPRLDHWSMFPASSGGREERRLMVLGEVDFFAEKEKDVVKKEGLRAEGSNSDVNTGLQLLTRSDQSMVDGGVASDLEDKRIKNEVAQLQFELERMNAENQRLKGMLTQVTNNYSTLQKHLAVVMQQPPKKPEINGHTVPRKFLDLSPGGGAPMEEQSNSSSAERTLSGSPHVDFSRKKKMARDDSPESAGWALNKAAKLNSDQSAAEATMRKARVSVRARSEAPMISDGCQWRKYGQKMAKGNPCPRAYYRCTMAAGCPVRKQVQRCAEDRTVLITTYEGTHNHPLPPAAMAMASTTTSAASMLLSGSMSSADSLMNPNYLARTFLPCSSNMAATISASAPFPTVTLDLTAQTPNPLQSQKSFPPHFQQTLIPAAPNQSRFSAVQMSDPMNDASKLKEQSSPSPPNPHYHHQPQSLADTLSAAATAAIASDPNFTAALAAAISSIIGGGASSQPNNSNHSVNTTDANKNSSTSPRN